MTRRMWALAVTAWVVVVIAGSAITWVAIDRAGRQVTDAAGAASTRPPVVGSVGSPPIVTGTPSGKPSAGSSSSPSPGHAGTGSPTTRPTTRPTHRPGSGPTSSAPPATRTETRTWSGQAGTVTVSCTGQKVLFKSASPNDGWSFERGDDAGDGLEVTFKKSETEVQVRATCVGGVPQFHVESDGSSTSYED